MKGLVAVLTKVIGAAIALTVATTIVIYFVYPQFLDAWLKQIAEQAVAKMLCGLWPWGC